MDATPARFARYPSLAGARVYLTGGASGIGAAMVAAFTAQGARVAFVDRDAAGGEALAARLAAAHPDVPPWFAALDVTDTAALQASVNAAAAALGGLDVLVNNVANDERHSFAALTPEAWRARLAVNLDPAVFAAQAALPHLRAAGGGSIVTFSSINALMGPPDMPAYVVAKAGLLGLTRALAREFGPDRIRVNAILPGWVVTERQLALWLTPEAEAAWRAQCSLKDRILPEDVAQLALFLAAEDSRMITGQALQIDAGRV